MKYKKGAMAIWTQDKKTTMSPITDTDSQRQSSETDLVWKPIRRRAFFVENDNRFF